MKPGWLSLDSRVTLSSPPQFILDSESIDPNDTGQMGFTLGLRDDHVYPVLMTCFLYVYHISVYLLYIYKCISALDLSWLRDCCPGNQGLLAAPC